MVMVSDNEKITNILAGLQSKKMALQREMELIDSDVKVLERAQVILSSNGNTEYANLPGIGIDKEMQSKIMQASNRMEAVKIIARKENNLANVTKTADTLLLSAFLQPVSMI